MEIPHRICKMNKISITLIEKTGNGENTNIEILM